MPDLDSLLNFFYIVAFLAAMILPTFQRQRREEARKRAESQRQAHEVPTIEERSPEDVPEPTVRRAAPAPEAKANDSRGAEVAAPEAKAPSAASVAPASVVAEPEAAEVPEVAAAAAQTVGGSDLTDLDDEIDLTALDDAFVVAGFDEGREGSPRGQPLAAVLEERPSAVGSSHPAFSNRAALRQAMIWREVLDRPLALRDERSSRH